MVPIVPSKSASATGSLANSTTTRSAALSSTSLNSMARLCPRNGLDQVELAERNVFLTKSLTRCARAACSRACAVWCTEKTVSAASAPMARLAAETASQCRVTNLRVAYQAVCGRARIGRPSRYRSISSATCRADPYRLVGSFSNIFSTMVERSPRISPRRCCKDTERLPAASSVSTVVGGAGATSPVARFNSLNTEFGSPNGQPPHNSSYKTTPSEKMSVAMFSRSPFSCSGLA